MLRRYFPQPGLSFILLLTWLLLQNTLAPGHIVLGAVLGILIPLLTVRFWPEPIRLRRPLVLLGFVARVLGDIVLANLNVAKLLLSPDPMLRPCFVTLPLAVKDDFTIFLLTNTISLTPGTVAAELSADRRQLLVHCLDLEDEAALIRQIKTRYEQPLQEVFETC